MIVCSFRPGKLIITSLLCLLKQPAEQSQPFLSNQFNSTLLISDILGPKAKGRLRRECVCEDPRYIKENWV